jgi:hypothetical protein
LQWCSIGTSFVCVCVFPKQGYCSLPPSLPPFFRFLPAQPSPPNGRHVLPPPRARVYIYMGPWQASPLWRRPKGGLVSTHKANQAKPAECVRGHTAGSRERTRASLPLLISILPSPTARGFQLARRHVQHRQRSSVLLPRPFFVRVAAAAHLQGTPHVGHAHSAKERRPRAHCSTAVVVVSAYARALLTAVK